MLVLSLAQQPTALPQQVVPALVFYGLAALTVLSAWAIVLSQNVVRMAVYLLLTLAGVAGFYFMLHAEFLAAVQLIVYAGGTLILIVFGVMLTHRLPAATLTPAGWERALGAAIGIIMALLLLLALASSEMADTPAPGITGEPIPDYSVVENVGKALLSRYLAPFEVAAVLLLVVMIGAAYMARRRHENAGQTPPTGGPRPEN